MCLKVTAITRIPANCASGYIGILYTTTHIYSNYRSNDTNTHTGTCEICRATITAAHVRNPVTNLCKICGYSYPIILESIPAPRPYEPEERAA